ncbi:MAG: sugar ABC transporter permease [Geminicoccaceae bacterium]|nr:sugar ABC transporter permease [Geminicoccaceae bacterium]
MPTASPGAGRKSARSIRWRRQLPATMALLPAAIIVVVAYIGCMVWTVRLSFTSSKLLPKFDWVGLGQYQRLFANERFIVSIENLFIFGTLFIAGSLVLGFLLAVFIDQRIRAEGVFRTIYLYPHALSFIVTGLVWRWFLNPTYGLQEMVRNMGFETFTFDWIVSREMAIYTIVVAAIWQASGLVMAILLAGLRGIDQEIWKAVKVDGIPIWRVYWSVILPMLKPMVVTATVLLSLAVVKVYDIVVAMTQGGPGISTEVPAKFVMDHLFNRANVGLAMACATVMLLAVVVVISPWLYHQYGPRNRDKRA